jgi:hypothetical protein
MNLYTEEEVKVLSTVDNELERIKLNANKEAIAVK